MPRAWPYILRGIQSADDGSRANLTGATAEEGGVPRVWSGYCGGIVTDALSDPECRGLGGGLVREPPSQPREAQTYRVSLTKHMQMIQLPVEGCLGGLRIRLTSGLTFCTATRGTQ